MSKKKIYIVGQVTGLPSEDVAKKFDNAARILRDLGLIALNPVEIVNDHYCAWEIAMRKCIASLVTGDAVFVLPCAKNSRGAKIELRLCADLEIPVFVRYNDIEKHFGIYPQEACEHPENRRRKITDSIAVNCETFHIVCSDCSKVLERIVDCGIQ